eukprot:1984217-Prymnesium_polylepis.1
MSAYKCIEIRALRHMRICRECWLAKSKSRFSAAWGVAERCGTDDEDRHTKEATRSGHDHTHRSTQGRRRVDDEGGRLAKLLR